MARLPIRMFGLFLLTISLSVTSCQAFVAALPGLNGASVIDQRDIHGNP